MWMPRWVAYLGNTCHRDTPWEESELVEEVRSFGQRSAGKPWVLVKVTVTSTTYLSIVADHVQLFVEMVIPNSKNVPEMV